MYRISTAIAIKRFYDEPLEVMLKELKDGRIDRVFLCGGEGFIYGNDCYFINEPKKTKKIIKILKENGFEVGIWISSLGHGSMMPGTKLTEDEKIFTNLKGVNGGFAEHGFCPDDENFRRIFCERIKMIAKLGPDLIQLDDDYRLNSRGGIVLACFCDKHLEEFYNRIGERLPLEEIRKRIFTGGKNKYRTAYMEMSRETLLSFAKCLRMAVDEVNPKIRLNSCGTLENWDASGTDMIEIAKAFAGNTRPFMRTNAGPYWHMGTTYKTIIDTIEMTRMQAHWCRGEDIEVFAEGDTFPRPRYNKPANLLELFDLPLFASNEVEGNLKYMFDYLFKTDYERGYNSKHIKNLALRDELGQIFDGKKPVGPRVVSTLHIAENMDIPEEYSEEIVSLKNDYRYLAFLSNNSIPTSFEKNDYPALVIGENAKYVTKEDLKNGAILDVKAAEILNRRGFDTGLITAKKASPSKESYLRHNDDVDRVDTGELYELSVKDKVEILTKFVPYDSPSSFIYGKFYVIAADMTYSYENKDYMTINFFFNYYRQDDLIYAIEKICGKKLPVVSRKNPMLYTLASKDKTSMAVILSNIFEDSVDNGRFELDKEYSSVKFVNCTGRLDGDTVIIDEIHPFSVAAFEVK